MIGGVEYSDLFYEIKKKILKYNNENKFYSIYFYIFTIQEYAYRECVLNDIFITEITQ